MEREKRAAEKEGKVIIKKRNREGVGGGGILISRMGKLLRVAFLSL